MAPSTRSCQQAHLTSDDAEAQREISHLCGGAQTGGALATRQQATAYLLLPGIPWAASEALGGLCSPLPPCPSLPAFVSLSFPHCYPTATLPGRTLCPPTATLHSGSAAPHQSPNRTGPSELASFSGPAMKVQPSCDWTPSTFHVHLLTCLLAVSFYKYLGRVSFIPGLSTGLACFLPMLFTGAVLPGADSSPARRCCSMCTCRVVGSKRAADKQGARLQNEAGLLGITCK